MDARRFALGIAAGWLLLAAPGCDGAACQATLSEVNSCFMQCQSSVGSGELSPCGTTIMRRCSARCCPTDPDSLKCLPGPKMPDRGTYAEVFCRTRSPRPGARD
jgi:hypothetical protein